MSIGTFDAFTTARLGIYAAQHGLRVTGNNISNINTIGYTRQRLDQVSFKAGAFDRYRSQMENHVGSGALVMNINQIRDPYLDIRFRNTNADVGYHGTMVSGLKELQDILDEVGKGNDTNVNEKGDGLLNAQFQAVADALRKFAKEPTKANDILVRNAASTLCSIFKGYADKLEVLRKETEESFKSQVTQINECLTNIRDLNKEIRNCEVYGDNALELRDERNRQIDTLSELMHIKVVYGEETIAGGLTVEKLSIYMAGDNPDGDVHTDETLLIDGIFGTQISSPEDLPLLNPDYDPATKPADKQPEAFRYLTDEPLKDGTEYVYKQADGTYVNVDLDNGATPPDGAVQVMKGTNDPAEAATYKNDNYTVRVGKLLDDKLNEWTKTITEWTDVTVQTPSNATYEIPISAAAGLKAGDKIMIAGAEYEVTQGDIDDPDVFAASVAQRLNNPDYTITVKGGGSGTIVFTANNPGVPGSGAPAPEKAPLVTVENAAGKINIGVRRCTDPGYQNGPPADMTDAGTVTNADGSETAIQYVQDPESGRWSRVVSRTEHTFETTLDDNDLYGVIQATREQLTEAGEFTTKDTVEKVDENAAKKRGIPYYQKSLDLLAREFAKQYNGLNQGLARDENGNLIPNTETKTFPRLTVDANGNVMMVETDADGNVVWDPADPTKPLYKPYKNWEADQNKYCVREGADGIKYYTGFHGDENGVGCIIHERIPVAERDANGKITNYEDVLAGLKKTGFDYAACNDIDNEPDPQKKAEMVDDLLTRCLAEHGVQLGNNLDAQGLPDIIVVTTKDVEMGGPLFSNRNDNNDTEGITASNISVSHGWSTGDIELVPKFEILWDGDVEHSTQNTNADHMGTMLEKDLVFNPKDLVEDAVSDRLYEGNFNGMFNNLGTTLGNDKRAEEIDLDNSAIMLVEIDSSRDGVSGVDLNDEAMNMVQYQKAMNAAMRLMTAIDEALDRLINNTGMAGR